MLSTSNPDFFGALQLTEAGATGVRGAHAAPRAAEESSQELARAPTPPLNMAAKTAKAPRNNKGSATLTRARVGEEIFRTETTE